MLRLEACGPGQSGLLLVIRDIHLSFAGALFFDICANQVMMLGALQPPTMDSAEDWRKRQHGELMQLEVFRYCHIVFRMYGIDTRGRRANDISVCHDFTSLCRVSIRN